MRIPPPACAAIAAALLAACGGGGGAEGTSTSNDSAQVYAAEASLITEDTLSTVDAALSTAQAVVAVQASAAAPMQPLAADVQPLAVATVPVACPGGGTATLSVTGGTPASVLNGVLDAGESYTLVYAACSGAAGAVALDGTFTMAVADAGSGRLALTVGATALAATLPRGAATLDGTLALTVGETTDSGGLTTRSTQVQATSVALATRYASRSSRFTLSALNVARTSTWLAGVAQSSRYSGTHRLDAELPRASFGYTVGTTGEVAYDASGNPVSGSWTVALARGTVGCSVAGGTATITSDEDGDGTPERTWTILLETLGSAAG